jgi:hypothetical protein
MAHRDLGERGLFKAANAAAELTPVLGGTDESEVKRKKRQIVRQESRLARDQQPQRAVASAGRAPFGPCALSLDWDSELSPP